MHMKLSDENVPVQNLKSSLCKKEIKWDRKSGIKNLRTLFPIVRLPYIPRMLDALSTTWVGASPQFLRPWNVSVK